VERRLCSLHSPHMIFSPTEHCEAGCATLRAGRGNYVGAVLEQYGSAPAGDTGPPSACCILQPKLRAAPVVRYRTMVALNVLDLWPGFCGGIFLKPDVPRPVAAI